MKFDLLTLFPEMFSGPFDSSIIKRAKEKKLVEIRLHNIREYSVDRHRTVDDTPYGGGAGMVMKVEPLASCIESVKKLAPQSMIVMTSPHGKQLNQTLASDFAAKSGIIIICGRYEGIDERIRTLYVDEDVSLGDFVMSGGEIAAMAIVDSVTRLVPGVLGSIESATADSFSDGLLEYPQYTRPQEFNGLTVPDVLLSGNHEEIRKWRRGESLRRTRKLRPDLFVDFKPSAEDLRLMVESDD